MIQVVLYFMCLTFCTGLLVYLSEGAGSTGRDIGQLSVTVKYPPVVPEWLLAPLFPTSFTPSTALYLHPSIHTCNTALG